MCHYDDFFSGEYTSYVGRDAAYVFLETVLRSAKRCKLTVNYEFKKNMVITPKQVRKFQKETKCHICGEHVEGEDKVRDHCHVTGLYRGAAHNKCNLNHKLTWKIPVVFHNLRGY